MDEIVRSDSIEKVEDIPEIPEGWMAIEIPHACLTLNHDRIFYDPRIPTIQTTLTIEGEFGCTMISNGIDMSNFLDKRALVLIKDDR